MNNTIFFFLFLIIVFPTNANAQKQHEITLYKSIKDKAGNTRSLIVMDERTNKNVGIITTPRNNYELFFPENDMKKHIEETFSKQNKNPKLENDIVLIVNELNVYHDEANSGIYTARMNMSSFIKRNSKYYFINRINTSFTKDRKDGAVTPNYFEFIFTEGISGIINDAYKTIPLSVPIQESELKNYEKIVSNGLPISQAETLREGVYKDFRSFIMQKTDSNLTIERNKNEEVKKVVTVTGNYDVLDFFAVVDKGKAYRATPVGFLELQKDERGYFVYSNKVDLIPAQGNSAAMTGAMVGGLVGALIGTVIDAGMQKSQSNKTPKYNVYLDLLTGEYLF